MHILRLLLLIITFCWLGGGLLVGAQTAESGTGCENATTTAAMRSCENARYEKAQRELNTIYQQLMAELNAAQKTKLRRAQRVWLRYREAHADFEASAAEGGTLEPLLKISTLADMTEARAAELRKALQK